jgi:predicted DNA binding CopG/RHH family protein
MKAEDRLKKVFSLLLAAARKDDKLAAEIDALIGTEKRAAAASGTPRNRRKPAPFDPFVVYEQGESALRIRLAELDLEALKDIVAEHGMDPGKLVLRWKTMDRVLEHIVSTVQARSKKGDAFRS